MTPCRHEAFARTRTDETEFRHAVMQRPDTMQNVVRCISVLFGLMALAALGPTPTAVGQNLVYQPTNPAFGGSPANFQSLLQRAQQQNPTEGGQDDFGAFRDDPLQNFEQRLQRQIFDQLSREIVQQRFGDQIDLTQEGQFDLENFTVEVTPGTQGISIRVFNKNTGETSTIEIPRF